MKPPKYAFGQGAPARDSETFLRGPLIKADLLDIARRNLIAIKEDVERGISVDPELIADMEATLARLEARTTADGDRGF